MNKAAAFIAVFCCVAIVAEDQALFVKREALDNGKRPTRQTSADQMVQNILQWLQGVYTQNSRRIRQGSFREYLPPSNTQKPRPFEPPGQSSEDNFIGYPPSGSVTPQPPFNTETRPHTDITPPEFGGGPTNSGGPTTGYPGGPSSGYPGGPTSGYPGGSTNGYPGGLSTNNYPGGPTTGYPGGLTTGYPGGPSSRPTTGYPGYPSGGYPSPSSTSNYPTSTEGNGGPSGPTTGGYPDQKPTNGPSTGYPTAPTSQTGGPTRPPSGGFTTYQPSGSGSGPSGNTEKPGNDGDNSITPTESNPDDPSKHPPHIHAINVDCAKDMMTINIEFNRQFDGVIYSKGFYNSPECRYVKENSAQTKYSFTVSLNSCGTEFVNAFDTEGKSYLENVLVLQNEPGIQEVWDTIRSVRCLWEGNLNKALSVSLNVGMLSQEIVTFSGDTAMARLDIQLGRGPFAPPANGLVKIGEIMTLVVSVSGDPGFDIQVRDCTAKTANGAHSVALTDDNGCVLKPKLFGAFQKTRNTQNTGASIIAYAFFNAFKFPDVMDLLLECNVELCKTDCEMCPNPQNTEPGRRRRSVDASASLNNSADLLGSDGVTMGKMLRVVLPEDLADLKGVFERDGSHANSVCMTYEGFFFASSLLLVFLVSSCFFSAYLWLKNQQLTLKF